MGNSNTTYEGTFLSMKPVTNLYSNNSDNHEMKIYLNIDNNNYGMYLKCDNPNYKKIYNTLQKDHVYRFIIGSWPSGQDIIDVKEQLTYTANIKITDFLDLSKQYNNWHDLHQVLHERDSDNYRALYDTGDNDKIREFSKNEKLKLKLIIDTKHISNIELGANYVVKFKKHYFENLYYIFEYEKVYMSGLNINHEQKVKLL